MIYLYIDENRIKLLSLKKTMLGQYETVFFEKKHETQLLSNGKVVSTDLLASAIKEAFSLASAKSIGDKDVFLILPQESFHFLRTEVPQDIAPSAINPFIRDKARAELPVDLDSCLSDYFFQETDTQKVITFYALDRENMASFQQALKLIDLKIITILPDTLAYFKLFEKTLRREKRENILYVFSEKDATFGYTFDSYGLIEGKKWTTSISDAKNLEAALKEKAQTLQENKMKLNRIILSGPISDTIRQDTFTKAVGVWTNPLKRIIPTFYNEYLKVLLMNQNKQFPILSLDVCFGGFIFHQENKTFSMLKNGFKLVNPVKSFSLPKLSLPVKEIAIFVGSFALSFIFFLAITNLKLKLPSFNKTSTAVKTPTPTSTPMPTPTPTFQRVDLKIKVLNGSGTAGKATEVKDLLKNKGYQDIVTGNADSFDFTQSELQVKKSKADAFSMVQVDLKDYVSSFKQTALDEKEAADVVLIIGKDFK